MGAKADKIIELKNTVAAYEGQIDAFKVAMQGKNKEISARDNIIENLKIDIHHLSVDLKNKTDELALFCSIDSGRLRDDTISALRVERDMALAKNKKIKAVVEKFKQLGQITIELNNLMEGV